MKRTTQCNMILAGGVLGLVNIAMAVAAEPRPNVLFILTDDQRADCVGLNPRSVITTPNTDRLGREGVYFPNHFCATSLVYIRRQPVVL